MSKTKEELNELKKDVEAVNEKLRELTSEELEQVTGGITINPGVQFASVSEGKSGDNAGFWSVR